METEEQRAAQPRPYRFRFLPPSCHGHSANVRPDPRTGRQRTIIRWSFSRRIRRISMTLGAMNWLTRSRFGVVSGGLRRCGPCQ